jgi:hypothetical protein
MAVAGDMHTSSEQYATLPADRLDMLRRCLPSHNEQARPVDLFETNPPRIWHVQNDRLHVVGLFNWSEQSAADIVYDLDKLGLDRRATYVGFDYWANKPISPIQGQLNRTVAPASCQVLALRRAADHPQLLSTSRHITQGLIDVREEKWDAATRTLSGRSAVVGDDPYELRIVLPTTGNGKIAKLVVDDASGAAGCTIRTVAEQPGVARVVIESADSRQVSWSVTFE